MKAFKTVATISLFAIALLTIIHSPVVAQEKAELPFFPDGSYDSSIPTPEAVLGIPIGERPVRYHEVQQYFYKLAEVSPRLKLVASGRTHEGRTLYYALISSEANMNKLEQIKSDMGRLADPRNTTGAAANSLIETLPAVAWMMYSIHGDEISGVDASMQLAYQLVAGNDPLTEKLRQELLIGIDPIENPDGRERFLAEVQQWSGQVSNWDIQSMNHNTPWPGGRTNHYLFDLNRDWFILSQPESRARVAAINEWNPQLVIDAHEMGAFSSYLFPPSREPINQNFSKTILDWIKTFSKDQAGAFDRYGWSYYTREWLEDYYPGYGSSWPITRSAVAILYEQASTDGSPVKRPDGTVLTFRESVHHQFTSSVANLATAANNRKALLNDFYKLRREAISAKNGPAAYYIDPGKNPARAQRLVERLLHQGIEVSVAQADFRPSGLRSYWDKSPQSVTLPKGSYIIPMNQPLRPLINAILEFDPRMSMKFLQSERKSLEQGKGTRLYEVSAWSMLMAYGVQGYLSSGKPSVKSVPVTIDKNQPGQVFQETARYGYVIDYRDDRAVNALVKLLQKGYTVRSAIESFRLGTLDMPVGTLLLRKNENPPTLLQGLAEICRQTGIDAHGVDTGLAEKGTDLGGGNFTLLRRPRVAMLAGVGLSAYNIGAMWYLFDFELSQRVSLLDHTDLMPTDLRKYNVLILPSSRGGAAAYRHLLGKTAIGKLKDWVKAGGTLIGSGTAAAFLADSAGGFSAVKQRRQALSELGEYGLAVEQERAIGKTKLDSVTIWENRSVVINPPKLPRAIDKTEVKIFDGQLRTFRPRGAIVRVDLNEEHWLSYGVGPKVPALLSGNYAFLSKRPVQTAGRLSDIPDLRLSGLLWPEAKERWANSAYLTRESFGRGQVILFAGEANFRSYFYGTARLLVNAVLLGPGFGSSQPMEW